MPQIVPAPPSLRSAGRCGSWPTKIDSWGRAATSARELSKLPELSLTPATMAGYAAASRDTIATDRPTPLTCGIW